MTPGGIRTRDLSFQRRCNSDLHHGPWVESWRGTDDAVATLAGVRALNPLGAIAPFRSNRHLHHRLADACASTIERHAGERAISASVTATQRRSLRKRNCAGPRASPREAASRCVCQGRDSNPLFPVERSIRNLHHQRRFSRARRQTGLKTNFFAALQTAPLPRTPWGSLCHRYPAYASFPPTGPALLGTRLPARAPGSGSPVPACAGMFRMSLLRTTKNPPEQLAREGPNRADCRSRLGEIAPMSRTCVIEWPIAIR
jgi:hypothetical protein